MASTRVVLSRTGIAIAVRQSSNFTVISLDDMTVHVLTSSGQPLFILSQQCKIWSIALHGNTLLGGDMDCGRIHMWDLSTGHQTRTFAGHSATVRCIAFVSADCFISTSRDTTVKLWSLKAEADNGSCIATFTGHGASVVDLALDASSLVAATGSYDGTCRLWDLVGKRECLKVGSEDEERVRTVEFIRIPDVGTGSQELVVTGGVNGHVSCWNSGTGAHIATLSGHTSMIVHLVTAVDLTTGVNTLIAADTNGAIRAWDPCGSWSLRWEVPTAHGKAVRSLNARDKHVISGSADGTVKVWEVATGHLVKQVGDTGSGRAIYNVAFNEDGQAGINVVLGEGGDTVFEIIPFE